MLSLAKWLSICLQTRGCGFESCCCHLNLLQPLAETLPLYISYSTYFTQVLESLPPDNPCQTIFSLLFHSFYTPYPLSVSYILLSCHEADHVDCNSPPPQVILQHPTEYLPPPPPPSNFALVNWNPTSTQSLSCSSLVSLSHLTPIQPHVTSVGYSKPHAKVSQSTGFKPTTT